MYIAEYNALYAMYSPPPLLEAHSLVGGEHDDAINDRRDAVLSADHTTQGI